MNVVGRGLIALSVGAVLLAGAGCDGTFKNNEQTRTCKVTDKTVMMVKDSDGGMKHEYRVFTEDCDVLVVVEAFGKWDSATRYNQVKPGTTQTFVTWGTRNGFASWFPNIVEVKS